MLPEIMTYNPNTSSKEKKKIKSEIKPIVELLKLIPFGLEIEIKTENEESVIGPIKEEYLEDNHNDLLRIYGNHIPGKWYVLGIFSSSELTEKQISLASNMRDSLDEFGQAIREIYSSGNYAITPILIFRELMY
jgi:hypothetical protein